MRQATAMMMRDAAAAAAAATAAAFPASGQAAAAVPVPDPTRGGVGAVVWEQNPRVPLPSVAAARASRGAVGVASGRAEPVQPPVTVPADSPGDGVPARARVGVSDGVDNDGDELPPTDSDLDDAGVTIPPDARPGPARSALLDERHPTRRSRVRRIVSRGAAGEPADDAGANAGATEAAPDAEDGANATTGRRVRRRTGGES